MLSVPPEYLKFIRVSFSKIELEITIGWYIGVRHGFRIIILIMYVIRYNRKLNNFYPNLTRDIFYIQ